MANLWLAPAAMAQATSPQGTSPLNYVQPLTPQAVQVVQEHLRNLGVYSGRVDGVWGTDSQAALAQFQRTRGLQETGTLNAATVATLGLNPAELLAAQPGAAPAAAPGAAGTLSPASVRTVQGRLRQLGFYNGAVDGVWGANTQTAIQKFQQGRGLQATGQLNPATIGALGLDPNILTAP
jgi:peptidoglycan hydrolase-like protein with peptidoglycan-binding domain